MNNQIPIPKLEKQEREQEPKTQLLKGSEAPQIKKENPFYNEYHWGMADWVEHRLYLPESSEAVSFAIASHELGHLVDDGRIQPTRHNFEPTHQEELRAWERGWSYLEPYLNEYFSDESELTDVIRQIKDEVEQYMMQIVELTKPFYRETDEEELEHKKNFLETDEGKKIKERIDGMENEVARIVNRLGVHKLLQKVDWAKFSKVIKKTLLDIERDNEAQSKKA